MRPSSATHSSTARACAPLGASYGGHLANWLEATTTRYSASSATPGEVDLTTQWGESDFNYEREVTNGGPPWGGNPIWREQSPITYAASWKTPMLLSIGERDYRVPDRQHARELDHVAAHAGAEPAVGLAGCLALDPEARGQPALL